MVRMVNDYPAMIQMIQSDNRTINNKDEEMLPGLQLTMMMN
jgi:hypothetical protein